jgi:hypothetical protein
LFTHLADLLHNCFNDILSYGVVTASVVIGSILLSADDGIRMVEILVLSGTNGVTHGRFKINHYSTRNVLPVLCLAKKGIICAVLNAIILVSRNSSIGKDTVLEAVKLPTGITDSKTSLSDVNT